MARVTKKDRSEEGLTQMTEATVQTIYADRILNVAYGPFVSRLALGVEVGPGKGVHTTNLVIPTPILLEAMEAMLKAIYESDELKGTIIENLDTFKEQLSKHK